MKTVKRFTYILLPILAVMLTSCQGTPFTDSDFTSKIFPNGYWDFIIQIGAFVVLLIAVFFLGYKPIKKMVNKRQDYVANEIREAKEKNLQAEENLTQSKETVLANRRLASEIIDNAKIEAENQKQEILKSAEDEVLEMKKRAERDIKQSEEDAKEAIRQKMVEIALDASSEILKRNVNDEDNEKLVDEFIKEIDE